MLSERRRPLADPARGVVVRAVARAEPPVVVAGLVDRDAAEVRAHAKHDQGLWALHAVEVVLRVAQFGEVHVRGLGDLILGARPNEDWLAPPLNRDALAHTQLGDQPPAIASTSAAGFIWARNLIRQRRQAEAEMNLAPPAAARPVGQALPAAEARGERGAGTRLQRAPIIAQLNVRFAGSACRTRACYAVRLSPSTNFLGSTVVTYPPPGVVLRVTSD